MLYRRHELSQKDSTPDLYLPVNQFSDHQHGSQSSNEHSGFRFPLDLPGESLLHITSYLEPPALLSLARVCKLLSDYVKLDTTWHRAFATQFLGISPESDIQLLSWKRLLLRKSPQQSWRETFIARYKLLRRWGLSGNSTMTHTPLNVFTPGSRLQLASSHLASPATHWTPLPIPNIVTFTVSPATITRSYPLTSRATNVHIADELVGVEHVSSIHAHNGVGMALFGYPNGKVGFVNMQKSMDHANSTRQVVPFTCAMSDSHGAPVFSVAWETGTGKKDEVKLAVSVGLDGLLKIWETNRNSLALLWTSPPVIDAPYSSVSPALMDHGIVACALSTGSLVVWTGLKAVLPQFLRPVVSSEAPQRIDIPCPKVAPNSNVATISKITVDPSSSNQTVHLLVAYHAQSCIHRVSIDQVTRDVVITAFGDDPGLGLISCVEPLFVDVNDVNSTRSFVAVGDTLGCINIYDWSSSPVVEVDDVSAITSPIRPVRKIEAHADGGSVTALAWNETVLVSGSDTGEVKVWDGVNLEFIREFGPRSRGRSERSSEDIVGQISLVGDSQAVIFNVGSRIVGWWAGPAKRNIRGGVRSRHIAGTSKKKTGRASKVHDTHDLYSAITESRDLIRDSATLPEGVFERKQNELSQRLGLETLGLSEVEAVEYVLMLSREEHESAQTKVAGEIEEGVFDADFDLDGTGLIPSSSSNQRDLSPSPAPSETTVSSGASSRASSRRSSFHSSPQASRSFTRASPSSVNTKLQLSTRQPEEPKEAGPTQLGRPIDRPAQSKAKGVDHSEKHFPNMPKSTSPTSPSLSKRSISASSVSPPSAWSTPLALTKSSSSSHAKTSPAKGYQGKHKATAKNSDMEDMDDDLRFAIELSMAEAVSRGDVLRD